MVSVDVKPHVSFDESLVNDDGHTRANHKPANHESKVTFHGGGGFFLAHEVMGGGVGG